MQIQQAVICLLDKNADTELGQTSLHNSKIKILVLILLFMQHILCTFYHGADWHYISHDDAQYPVRLRQ